MQAHYYSLPVPIPEKISDEEIIQISKDIYLRTKNWKYIATKTFHLLNIRLTDEQKESIRQEVKREIDEMYREDIKLFQYINRSKLEIRLCKKLSVAKYFEQNKQA